MGAFFTPGEIKIRPGNYQRYENNGGAAPVSLDGVVAAAFKANWGPLESVKKISIDDAAEAYGSAQTADILAEIFKGGASYVYAARLGTGGTKGSLTLQDTNEAPADAITMTAKYEGNRAFQVVNRLALGDTTTKELVVYENGVLLEKLQYPVSASGEVDALIAKGAGSKYFDFAKVDGYTGNGVVATFAQKDVIPGTNPTVTNESYSNALNLLELYRWNTICTDSVEPAVHAILDAFMGRVYEGGKMGFDVVGEPVSVAFDTRCSHAAGFNRYNTIYAGGGFETSAGVLDGYKAVGRIAGLVAAVPSSQSITHYVISDAIAAAEMLTNTQYEQAIQSGMITFSVAASGAVWVESGVTSLVNPSGEDDEGWKKIKRTKVRMELMTRSNDVVEPLIGKVINNKDGQATVQQALQSVVNDMIAEEKLLQGGTVDFKEASPDSAFYEFVVDDADSLEKTYLVFKFRFSAAA